MAQASYFGRIKTVLVALLFLPLLAQVILLGRDVSRDLRDLAVAQTDSIQWSMAQTEVELLRSIDAMQLAQVRGPQAYGEMRKRFDIFFSRINTLNTSTNYAPLRELPENVVILRSLQSFLDEAAVIVDLPNEAIEAELQTLVDMTRAQITPVRALSLSSVSVFARSSDDKRLGVSATMERLAISGLFLIMALMVFVLVLIRLLRRSDAVAAENQIVHSRMEAMVTSSLDAILVLDTEGRILEFNGAAEEVFGYRRDEAVGHDMEQLIVPEHLRAAHVRGMKRFLRTQDKRVIDAGRLRLEALRKNGEAFPVEVSITTATAKEGLVFVSFLRDITQQVESEGKLKRARDEARAGEKAKSNLLTVMSHEMRTPLNGILGSIQLIRRDPLTARQERNLNAAKVSGDLLLNHVNDVLELSRLQVEEAQPQLAPFDMNVLLSQLKAGLFAQAKARGNRIETRLMSPDVRDVFGDATFLNRCLVNLAGNAVKFTSNGTVSIEVERTQGDTVELRVADTGVGIPKDKLESIFDEFVTLDPSYARQNAGTGLGLAITQRLIARMGGAITVTSEEGRGSLFTIALPLPPIDPPIEEIANATVMHDRVDGIEPKNLLIVEDNEINRDIIVDMLSELGHKTTQAVDGFDGVAKAGATAYDAIIMDISMPGMSGIEALEKIRAEPGACQNVPVIAATAHAAAEDHARISRAGFAGIVTKPIDMHQLEHALNAVLLKNADGAFVYRSKGQGAKADLEARLGPEKTQKVSEYLRNEATKFVAVLQGHDRLEPADRAKAHDLSGMAGLLELEEVQMLMQAIEECPDDDWAEEGPDLVTGLDGALQGLDG